MARTHIAIRFETTLQMCTTQSARFEQHSYVFINLATSHAARGIAVICSIRVLARCMHQHSNEYQTQVLMHRAMCAQVMFLFCCK